MLSGGGGSSVTASSSNLHLLRRLVSKWQTVQSRAIPAPVNRLTAAMLLLCIEYASRGLQQGSHEAVNCLRMLKGTSVWFGLPNRECCWHSPVSALSPCMLAHSLACATD